MRPFRKTTYSVYLPDGTRCRGNFYPGGTGLIGIHVHGFRSSVSNTKARYFLDHALDQGYSWTNFDLPCHGRSEGRFRTFRISTALAAVTEVIQQFRGSSVLLVGSSLGAWLSMLAARKLADSADVHIAGAILIAPAFDFVEQYFKSDPREVLDKWKYDGVRQIRDPYDGSIYELDYAFLDDGMKHTLLNKPVRYDFPVRIFHGEQDDVVPMELSERFKTMTTGSDVDIYNIKGGGHSLNDCLPMITKEIDGMFDQSEMRKAV